MIAEKNEIKMAVEKDVILVHRDYSPLCYARVERIRPDVKPGWWRIDFLLLGIPMQQVSWVIEEQHLSGEPFMMGETRFSIELVQPTRFADDCWEEKRDNDRPRTNGGAKVIPLFGRR